MEENKQPNNELDTLEEPETTVTESSGEAVTGAEAEVAKKKSSMSPGVLFAKLASRINVYLLAFILLIIVSLVIVFVVIQSSNKEVAKQKNITAQELTQEAVDQLTSNEATVGDPKQLLTVESNAVFSGKVLIRDGLDVAGPIKVGGSLSLPGITVSGTSQFDEVTANSLSIAGDTNIQGVLTVQKTLTVSGKASFGGGISASSITLDALQLNGDIQFNRHIDAGGGTPGVSEGGATGSGGTVSISGTDTAGTVTVNVGSGASSGVLATVRFTNAFNSRPHVVFTPVASVGSGPVSSGSQKFYITSRTSSGFSIAVSGGLSAGSVSFDYIVID